MCLLHGTSEFFILVLYWALIGVDGAWPRRIGQATTPRAPPPPRALRSEAKAGFPHEKPVLSFGGKGCGISERILAVSQGAEEVLDGTHHIGAWRGGDAVVSGGRFSSRPFHLLLILIEPMAFQKGGNRLGRHFVPGGIPV